MTIDVLALAASGGGGGGPNLLLALALLAGVIAELARIGAIR